MSVSLRTMLAACLGGVGLVFTVGTAVLLNAEAGGRMQGVIGDQLHQYADQVADKLDRGMFERYRDLLVATSLDSVRSPDASRDSRRAVVQRLKDTYTDYAWIGFIEPNGILQVATDRVLEGMDVNARGWWKQGLERPYVGDVHDAIVLGKLLYANRAEPPRFVDLAAPVHAEDGTLLGVIAAHLSWDWAMEVERSVLGQVDKARHVEAMILAGDDTVILGPKELIGQRIGAVSATVADSAAIRTWPDGVGYLTSTAATQGYRGYPGLAWKVVLREPATLALAPVREMRNRVIAWGAAASLLAVLVGYLLAGWISAPLRAMARAVREAGATGGRPALPATGHYAEIDTLSDAMRAYLDEIREGERRLKDSLGEKTILLHEIHHRVKNNLQVIYGLMMVEVRQLPKEERGRARMEAVARRITSMGRLHEQLYMSGDFARIDLGEHLLHLCEALSDLRPNEAVALRVEAAPATCSLELALPFGLIANELMTNSLKHAFPEGRGGTVTITLHDGPDALVMEVSDDGIGCAGGLPTGGIGTTLVNGLVRQIGGTLTFDTRQGCIARVSVPKARPAVPALPEAPAQTMAA
ncbi:sensor histidine kinase [Azospirillum doebereinerae]|uniref:sensor histidine kinase n=1 Tax=Azospirillum doebereinerae TaxID=92933 RepID=UPI001FD30835|nr:sensor histidine kinase [Azospirillum doebereinerae]